MATAPKKSAAAQAVSSAAPMEPPASVMEPTATPRALPTPAEAAAVAEPVAEI